MLFIDSPTLLLLLSTGFLLTFCEKTNAWWMEPAESGENTSPEGSQTEENPECVCVPEYLCDADTRKVITDGSGIIGSR